MAELLLLAPHWEYYHFHLGFHNKPGFQTQDWAWAALLRFRNGLEPVARPAVMPLKMRGYQDNMLCRPGTLLTQRKRFI
jgi:hypothetical protein